MKVRTYDCGEASVGGLYITRILSLVSLLAAIINTTLLVRITTYLSTSVFLAPSGHNLSTARNIVAIKVQSIVSYLITAVFLFFFATKAFSFTHSHAWRNVVASPPPPPPTGHTLVLLQ